MILAVMTFLLLTSAVVSVAAGAADEALRSVHRSTRWVWLGAMTAPWVLMLAPLLASVGSVPAVGPLLGAVPVIELPPLLVGDGGFGPGLGEIVIVLWLVTSLLMIGILGRTHYLLSRDRSTWRMTEVEGRQVYVSADRGPAVAGALRPWIVLPDWVLSMPREELRLVVLHEEEHIRARDALLLSTALALVVMSPWNPMSWWQLRRMRTAMEIDCDRRVLRRAPDRQCYGSSMLTVAARASGVSLGLAAFTERPHSLRKRIVAMTPKYSPWAPVRAALLLLLGSLMALQACGLDSPVVLDESRIGVQEARVESADQAAAIDIRAEPTFTPFTVAPSIQNRDEVVAAMAREYPSALRELGIGGTVRVFFFINEIGTVEQVRIDMSSGHQAFDDAAVNVAGAYEFTPALNEGERVPVWVSFPITFQPR